MERRHHQRIRRRAIEKAHIPEPPKRNWGKPLAIILVVSAVGLFLWFFVSRTMPERGGESESADRVVEVRGEGAQALSSAALAEYATKLLEASSVEELTGLVAHPELSEPRMRKYYAQEQNKLPIGGTLRQISETELDGTPVYAVIVERSNDLNVILPVVADENGKPSIEWEAVVGWFEPSWEELLETKPVEPTYVRVFVIADDYYNYDYRDDTKWQCLKLVDRSRGRFCYAYIERSDPISLRLAKFNAYAPVVLKIKFSPGQTQDQAEIVEFKNVSWFLKE